MSAVYFLIAILGLSLLCGLLSYAVVDWLLYKFFMKLELHLRDNLTFAFAFTTGTCVTLLVFAHLFIAGLNHVPY